MVYCKDSDCIFKKQCYNLIPAQMNNFEIEKCKYYKNEKESDDECKQKI